ncbi:Sec20-domain-containing protein [Polychytrium aggregatum]|uniref:Sec20-domain-containing protein n=1 Tax=Polychytrium aggregatum TaxID=110093 RepID=UPI0022FE40DF|nr:Sec20-domain-containing protein [Polychytrium aggregatum]KAI9202097.1 Sec20-domain-containing protein [Polychytrium aggregatum]
MPSGAVDPPAGVAPEVHQSLEQLSRRELAIEATIAELKEVASVKLINDLNLDLREQMRALQQAIQNLRLQAEYYDGTSSEWILGRLERHDGMHRQLQISIRQTNLFMKSELDRRAEREREELLKTSGTERQELWQQKLDTEEKLLQSNSELTSMLKNAVQMMNAEVEKSAQTTKALNDSTALLQKTHTEYSSYDRALRGGRAIITRLKRRDWTDKVMIMFGLLVFCLTVLHIIRKRVWIPGLPYGSKECPAGSWTCSPRKVNPAVVEDHHHHHHYHTGSSEKPKAAQNGDSHASDHAHEHHHEHHDHHDRFDFDGESNGMFV